MRERALASGALTVVPNVEVDRPRRRGRARSGGCAPSGGDIEAEAVVIACGVWSPKIGDMAGISIPLTPAVHQMISVGPCPQLAGTEGEISFPIVRDMDTFCYERQHGADMEVGSYAHRAILHEPEEIPSIEQSKLSPTEMPFTADDFDPQLEQALRADARAARRRRRGDPLRDQRPAVADLRRQPDPRREPGQGPVDRVRGLDQGGSGRRPRGRRVDDARLTPRSTSTTATSRASTRTRCGASTRRLRTTESFIKTYGIIHPARAVRVRPRRSGSRR